MEDEIVSLETAMLLKEKGFNEPCCHFYEDNELRELNYYQGNGAGFVRNNSPINDMMYCEEMQCTAPTSEYPNAIPTMVLPSIMPVHASNVGFSTACLRFLWIISMAYSA